MGSCFSSVYSIKFPDGTGVEVKRDRPNAACYAPLYGELEAAWNLEKLKAGKLDGEGLDLQKKILRQSLNSYFKLAVPGEYFNNPEERKALPTIEAERIHLYVTPWDDKVNRVTSDSYRRDPELLYVLEKILWKFPATSPYILPRDWSQSMSHITVDMRKCPTYIAYFIFNIVRQVDEKYDAHCERILQEVPERYWKEILFYLFLRNKGFDLRSMSQESRTPKAGFVISSEYNNHTLGAFYSSRGRSGIPKQCIKEFFEEGSLDYFERNADKELKGVFFNTEEGNSQRSISRYFSPCVPEKEELEASFLNVPPFEEVLDWIEAIKKEVGC